MAEQHTPIAEYLPQTWVTAVAKECGLETDRLSCLFDFAERVQRAAKLAPVEAGLILTPTDEEIEAAVIKALADMSASGEVWGRFTYESGPYEITKLRRVTLEICRAAIATTKQEPLS